MAGEQTKISPEEQAAYEAIHATVGRMNEVLAKSGFPMEKDENEPSDNLETQAETELPPGDGAPAEAPADGGGMPGEGAPGEGAPAEAAPGEGGMPGEGGESPEAMQAELADLSDDELAMLMQAGQAEMEKRQAAQAPAADGAGAPAAGPDLAMSMKSEFASLAKSFQAEFAQVRSTIKAIDAKVEGMRKSQTAAPARQPTRAAATGRESPQVKVLAKSGNGERAQAEPLSKSDTIRYLESNMRDKNNRHPAVNTDLIATVMATHEPADLVALQADMRKQGINLPQG